MTPDPSNWLIVGFLVGKSCESRDHQCIGFRGVFKAQIREEPIQNLSNQHTQFSLSREESRATHSEGEGNKNIGLM